MRRTRRGTSTRTTRAKSWSCTRWGSAQATPRKTCRSSLASSPASASTSSRRTPRPRSRHRSLITSATGCSNSTPLATTTAASISSGHTVEGRGFAEVEQALDILARHPATATYVSRKIATYFLSDTPPDVLVQRMAQSFRTTDGDIVSVLLVMFESPEFMASLTAKTKYKDPMQFVLSAVRLAYDNKVILNAGPIIGWVNRLAEGLYNHQTPDGYPMTAAAWNGPGQMATRFEIARAIGSNAAGLFKAPPPDTAERPAFPQIASAFYFNVMQPTLSPATRVALEQAGSPQEWNTLFLSSPEFMR